MSNAKVYQGKKGTKISYPTRRRSNVSSRRPLNRYETESDPTGVSASAKKLKFSDEEFDINYDSSYRIKNFLAVFSVISQHVKCKTCDSDITFHEKSPRGLGFKIVIVCPNCPDVVIAHAERSLTDETKEARSNTKSSRKEEEEENLNIEGQLYGTGIAD